MVLYTVNYITSFVQRACFLHINSDFPQIFQRLFFYPHNYNITLTTFQYWYVEIHGNHFSEGTVSTCVARGICKEKALPYPAKPFLS